jgi:tetratricopeptide (TPR) repeat protein
MLQDTMDAAEDGLQGLKRSIVLVALGRHREAWLTLDHLVALYPHSAIPWLLRAIILLKRGEYEEALAASDRALALDPNEAESLNAKGMALYGLRRYEEAHAAFDQTLALARDAASAPGPDLDLMVGLLSQQQGTRDAASAPAPGASADDLIAHGKALVAKNQYAEAMPFFERATRLAPNSFDAWFSLGYVCNMLGRSEEALMAYERALALDPTNAAARNNKGNALWGLKRYGEALVALGNAPRDPVRDATHKPDPDESADGLTAHSKAPETKQPKQTGPLPERDYPLAPGSLDAWFHIGRAYDTLFHLGRAYSLPQHWLERLAACDRALALDPNDAVTWAIKGDALRNLGREEEALAAYDQALALNPNFAVAWNNKGNALYGLKRYKEAIAAYDRALALNPNFAVAWSNKASCLRALGREAQAQEAERRAKALGG